MRLLHTSDWHLGRSLHRADLRDAQAGFLDRLVETVRSEKVDAVLVAGDVYDRAVPSLDAVELCESALVRLREAGARVVLISGNHDSPRRLGFGSRLVDAAGVHLRTRVADSGVPVLLEDAAGPVAVYGIPYLEPEAVRGELPPETGRGHAAVLGAALSAARADLAARAAARSVVLAHAWVGSATACDSERDITVGGVACVPTSLFDGFTYTALGHLHGPQVLADGLRYSGSPLAYSFSEAGHVKGSWLVELSATGLSRVEHVPAPQPRRLSTLRGSLEELLSSSAYDGQADDWLQVTLTDGVRPDEAMARLAVRFPHILVLRHEPEGVAVDTRSYTARVAGRTPLEIGGAFAEHVRGSALDEAEAALLSQALEADRLVAR
ncbi:MAG: repair protein SbcD/Mre11 [Actinomycetota bacterium]|jgi:exonuclease SbcD|nr:repair protein SbcD/Mre11 [Actinomycetota bacterium]